MGKYLQKFLNMKCAGDVIGVIGPMKNYEKEISEASSIVHHVREIPNIEEYTLIDFCSGNALVPVLSVFTTGVKKAIAVDIRKRKRPWEKVKRFEYVIGDIYDQEFINKIMPCPGKYIVTGCHACGELSKRIVDLFKTRGDHLILMPCCVGKKKTSKTQIPQVIKDKIGRYLEWSLHLYERAKSKDFGFAKLDNKKARLIVDENVLSPCNALIIVKNNYSLKL
jgi:hypothetical protein